ncbi:MAG: sulfite exporter TauE/SafE family protein [Deltaproteobacteria bacterium]|nr:sulfite exporter TauE/SafE family protein [Deltaproteobacteria bacterium]
MVDFYPAVAAISFLAGLVQGLTGFGSALLAMPLFLLFLDARTAVPLSILNGLIITIYLCLQLKQHLDWGKIFPLLLGCLPGIMAGVYFLKRADNTWIKILLGILLVGYASFSLRFKPRAIRIPSFGPYAAGFATGVIGAAFSAGGPPAIIYTMLTGWSKDSIKATLSGRLCTLDFRADQRSGIAIPVSQRPACHKRGMARLTHLFQDIPGIVYPAHTDPAHWHGSAYDRLCDGLSCLKHAGKCVP